MVTDRPTSSFSSRGVSPRKSFEHQSSRSLGEGAHLGSPRRLLGGSPSAPALHATGARGPAARKSWREWAGREDGKSGYERGDIKRALRVRFTGAGQKGDASPRQSARFTVVATRGVDETARTLSKCASEPANFDFTFNTVPQYDIQALKESLDSDTQSTEITIDPLRVLRIQDLMNLSGTGSAGSLDFTFSSPRAAPAEREVTSIASPRDKNAPHAARALDFASLLESSNGSLDFTFSIPPGAPAEHTAVSIVSESNPELKLDLAGFHSLLQSSAGSLDFTFSSPRAAPDEGSESARAMDASEELLRLRAELARLEAQVLSPRAASVQ